MTKFNGIDDILGTPVIDGDYRIYTSKYYIADNDALNTIEYIIVILLQLHIISLSVEDTGIAIKVEASDIFTWGGSDAEPIAYNDVRKLWQMIWTYGEDGIKYYVIKSRKMLPNAITLTSLNKDVLLSLGDLDDNAGDVETRKRILERKNGHYYVHTDIRFSTWRKVREAVAHKMGYSKEDLYALMKAVRNRHIPTPLYLIEDVYMPLWIRSQVPIILKKDGESLSYVKKAADINLDLSEVIKRQEWIDAE